MEAEYLIDVGEEDEQLELVGQGNGAAYPDEDGEEEAIELPSAEELKKKCDDFIRKMKEGIKLEAQQFIIN
uniref:Uncharacterized protein n=1 Tax=Rhizophora mucronata TaxID=61149 RepID=A0A2P2NSR0_RHIMU